MDQVIEFYLVIAIIVVALAVLSLAIWDKRYRKNHGQDVPPGYEKTDELIIDPLSSKKLRVYFNSTTGERFYKEEK